MAVFLLLSGFPSGNRAWFKRAYERAKQQAEAEGRSLEDVAAERCGVRLIIINTVFETLDTVFNPALLVVMIAQNVM